MTRIENVAAWAGALGLGAELLRRLVFVIASGNGDAHLKNWSLLYPDRRRPVWSPLYDQVSTIAWLPNETLALPILGKQSFAAVHLSDLVEVGARAGLPRAEAGALVEATLSRLREAWDGGSGYPTHHAQVLRAHWRRKVPLLAPFGPMP